MSAKTLYDILDVDSNASSEDIKKSYKDKAKKLHPDKGGDHGEFTELNNAVSVLLDPVKRARYDSTGQTRETPFAAKFADMVNNVFMRVIADNDVERVDLLKEVKKHVKTTDKGQREAIKQMQDGVSRLKKVKDRLTDDGAISRMLETNINDAERNIVLAEENLVFFKECLSKLDEYKYRIDEVVIDQSVLLAQQPPEWYSDKKLMEWDDFMRKHFKNK